MQSEQQESAWIFEAWAWAETHRLHLVVGAAGVLGLVVAGYVYFWHQGRTELEANHALLALTSADRTSSEQGPSPETLLQVAGRYDSTQAATRARLLAAGELFAAGKYAEAQAQFEEVVARDASGLLAPMAALGVAACLDARDQTDAALAAYQNVVSRYLDDPVSGRARLAMAALHVSAGRPAEALKLYDSLLADRQAGRAAMEASVKRETLLKQHPELATTATAPAVPPVITPVGAGAPEGAGVSPASNPPPPAAGQGAAPGVTPAPPQ